MKTQVKKPEDVSHVIQSKTKAVKQAPVQEILQRYLDRTVQREAIEDEDELLQGKFEPVQREALDEEELLQGKFSNTIPRMESDEEELLQGKFDGNMTIQKQKMIDAEYKRLTHGWHGKDVPKKIKEKQEEKSKDEIRDRLLQNPANAALPVAQLKPNNTGLPDNVKTGIENLSGYSMDDVRVHYNSAKPAQLQALAYTQGTDIHVAPGQEKHLPHEAWHVVQQKQGRVQPTTQMQGVNVNDNKGLENEADVMGREAVVQHKICNKSIFKNNGLKSCTMQLQMSDEDINALRNLPDEFNHIELYHGDDREYLEEIGISTINTSKWNDPFLKNSILKGKESANELQSKTYEKVKALPDDKFDTYIRNWINGGHIDEGDLIKPSRFGFNGWCCSLYKDKTKGNAIYEIIFSQKFRKIKATKNNALYESDKTKLQFSDIKTDQAEVDILSSHEPNEPNVIVRKL